MLKHTHTRPAQLSHRRLKTDDSHAKCAAAATSMSSTPHAQTSCADCTNTCFRCMHRTSSRNSPGIYDTAPQHTCGRTQAAASAGVHSIRFSSSRCGATLWPRVCDAPSITRQHTHVCARSSRMHSLRARSPLMFYWPSTSQQQVGGGGVRRICTHTHARTHTREQRSRQQKAKDRIVVISNARRRRPRLQR